MLAILQTLEVTSLSGRATILTGEMIDNEPVSKIANVTVTNTEISCSVPVNANGDSQMNISINRASKRSNVSFSNVNSIPNALGLADLITVRLEAILTEIEGA